MFTHVKDNTRTAALASALLLVLILSACAGAPGNLASDQLTVAGWFTTISNGATRYQLTDDLGKTYELVLDEEILIANGGLLTVDRQRVIVVGELQDDGKLRVISLQLESNLYPHPSPK